jgi:hypothetical protein
MEDRRSFEVIASASPMATPKSRSNAITRLLAVAIAGGESTIPAAEAVRGVLAPKFDERKLAVVAALTATKVLARQLLMVESAALKLLLQPRADS